jgi:hypothetical protein
VIHHLGPPVTARLSTIARMAMPQPPFQPQSVAQMMPTEGHARIALAVVNKHGTPAQKQAMHKSVADLFPNIDPNNPANA